MGSMINDLLDPANLPDPTTKVSLVQTHISMVFIADSYVYKIKKPVDFGFLDFTTLEKRKFYCEQEIKLNRRLSKDIYLDVLPVLFDGDKYRLRGQRGEIVDYAVRMKKIPEQGLMKRLFVSGQLTEKHLEMVARKLAEFHKNAYRDPEVDKFGLPEVFKVNTDENFAQVEKYVGTAIEKQAFEMIQRWTDDFYMANKDLFLKRISEGKIRDGHGDLHMEHVCFHEKDVFIFDCIEFNDRFRYGDVLADISFLLMDLEYHGNKNFSDLIWLHYKNAAGEGDVESLLTFYKVYRAFVRGKVNSFQLQDPNIDKEGKNRALETARRYFELARDFILKGDK